MLSVAADEIDDAGGRAPGAVKGLSGSAWATDEAGRLVSAPDEMLALLGMTAEDLQPGPGGRPLDWRLLAHPEDGDAAAASWRLSLDAGHPYDVTLRLRAWRSCAPAVTPACRGRQSWLGSHRGLSGPRCPGADHGLVWHVHRSAA